MFTKAKWIWLPTEACDTYADFISDFEYHGGKAVLRISADSNYVAYINGKIAAFGQYSDYPTNKIGDEVDVTEYVREGKNRLAVIVWYYGYYAKTERMNFTYYPGNAGVIFEIEDASGITAASDENTLSRPDPGYIQGAKEIITFQIGLGFSRLMESADDSFITDGAVGFSKSCVIENQLKVSKSPIKKLILGDRIKTELLRVGRFSYPEDENITLAHKMHYADVGFRQLHNVSDKRRKFTFDGEPVSIKMDGGIFILVDLGAENAGFIDLDIEVPKACRIDIGWGEHLLDGVCRPTSRDFSIVFHAKAGRNSYMNPFRRFGGRYIELFIHSEEATVHYLGMRPTDYPLEMKPYDFGNMLRNTVYKVSADTLRLCMHEHYEDCPWREQSLYALDSRNQMLCGYYAFGEYEFARASLHLLGEGLLPSGQLAMCSPMVWDLIIPSFSLAYFISMREYIDYSGDTTLAAEMYETLEKIIASFTVRIDETGLIRSFDHDGTDWNFYEWNPTLQGSISKSCRCHEAALNLFFAIAMENMVSICRSLGKDGRADELDVLRKKIAKATADRFWDENDKLMHTSDEHTDTYSVLVNAYAVLSGAVEGKDISRIVELLVTNAKNPDGTVMDGIYPNTLSMNAFRFDALLKIDRERFAPMIIDEIDSSYLQMLRQNATSFWEVLGALSFDNNDDNWSLCHGWAALPIYYYSILLK